MKIEVPKKVELIIDKLNKNGYEAFAVGGCVRDAILKRVPNDWDITTSALPQDVKKIFKRTIDTGIEHGTVTVMIDHVGYEVTTYRIDGEYQDGRHPKDVEFTSNLVEDLMRRDFTINAMAYNNEIGLVDSFDGMNDISNKVIRCVGNAECRFNEDALRILRAVRFAASLDFNIEQETYKAIVKLAPNLVKISKERIQAELEKLLISNNPDKIMTAYNTGILRIIMPQINSLIENGNGNYIVDMLSRTSNDHFMRWTALLSKCTAVECKNILKNLKFDNNTVRTVSKIIEACDRKLVNDFAEIRKSIYEIGEDIYPVYLKFLQETAHDNQIELINEVTEKYHIIVNNNECFSLKNLAINGKDLLEIGTVTGSEIGQSLQMLLYKVMENQNLNNRETLLNIFKDTHS